MNLTYKIMRAVYIGSLGYFTIIWKSPLNFMTKLASRRINKVA